jgi:hypothetical protein
MMGLDLKRVRREGNNSLTDDQWKRIMISEKQARDMYALCRTEILLRARSEINEYIDVVFTDDGDIMMMYADVSKRHHLQQQNVFYFGMDCHITMQLNDVDYAFEDSIKELIGLTPVTEPINAVDINDLDYWR